LFCYYQCRLAPNPFVALVKYIHGGFQFHPYGQTS
jgi:hypothetical protein